MHVTTCEASGICVYCCSKSILEEYCETSSLLTEEIVKVHQEISTAVQQIDPLAEYQHFIEAYRSVWPPTLVTVPVQVVMMIASLISVQVVVVIISLVFHSGLQRHQR